MLRPSDGVVIVTALEVSARSNLTVRYDRICPVFVHFGGATPGDDSQSLMFCSHLMHRISDFLDAIGKYRAEVGHGLSVADLEKALRLPQVEYVSSDDEWRHRRRIREDGLETIVKGALRLAAHKILGEEPHFGGKHSVEVIQQGVKALEELKRPLPPARPKVNTLGGVDLGPPAGTPKRGQGGRRRSAGFGETDLKELRNAIKAKDDKRIAELTAKLGKPSRSRA